MRLPCLQAFEVAMVVRDGGPAVCRGISQHLGIVVSVAMIGASAPENTVVVDGRYPQRAHRPNGVEIDVTGRATA